MPTTHAMLDWPLHEIVAHNRIDDPRKQMHDPEVARRMGFAGALVPGTVVYAYMLRPLVARFGGDWFVPQVCELALLKPVYEGQRLRVQVRGDDPAQPQALSVQALDEAGTCLATLQVSVPRPMPAPTPQRGQPPAAPATERPPVSWERIVIGQPFARARWTPDAALQRAFCAEADETLPVFLDRPRAPLHPGLIVRRANDVLVHHFQAELGIHVASRIVRHRAPVVGETVEVAAVPLEKWRRKSHEYVKFHVTLLGTDAAGRAHAMAHADPAVAVELFHTMIYRPRGAP
ncbi:MAG: hypothetical protein HY342_02215 [Candidatus Lambdaproteobacteria bacterium]|nr:hypothetical protein [Candidatus Lambdaproteobacteria bacterium]